MAEDNKAAQTPPVTAHLWDFSGTFSSARGTSEGLSAAQSGKRVKGRKGPQTQVRGPFRGNVPGGGGRVGLYAGF
ncbi:hypothetical protein Sliba_62130 [Streptomyces nigrescens]|uniref:Uncharacterized protein n=1 Tax=Streptomyces nigrescens TaxID=1920 RepID=A0A640TRE1_STRNI|nr:hypothetical protein Sliba_62130 [Streptomyces libani subsp. libani]GGW03202.1 hypothetical protein GCM10010500_62210 [Streptomyces libani subsp. libani]